MAVPVLVFVAWGALAFGAVYDWAYAVLLVLCGATAVWGLARGVPGVRRQVCLPLLAGMLLTGAAIGVQLIPLDRAALMRLSPATDDFLRQYDVTYAFQVVTETREAATRAERRATRTTTPGVAPESGGGTTPGVVAGVVATPGVVAASMVTHPLSVNPAKTRLGLLFFIVFCALVLGLARGLDGFDLRIIAPGLAIVGTLMAFIAIVQAALWNGKVYGFWEPVNAGAQAYGPFINRNHFAGWMLMALPVVMAAFAARVSRGMTGVEPGWRNRAMWFATPEANRAALTGFAILVMSVSLAMSFSRSGIAGLVLAMIVAGALVVRRQATAVRKGFMAGYLLMIVVAAIGWAGLDTIVTRFSAADAGLADRAGAWADALRIHGLFPLFGTGFNTYGTATTVLQQYRAGEAHFVEAHSDYLQILVEGGYLVAVPAAILLLLFGWQVAARFREGNDDETGRWIRMGAVTGIFAILLQEAGEFSLQMPGNFALFAVLCAIAVRRSSVRARGEARPRENADARPSERRYERVGGDSDGSSGPASHPPASPGGRGPATALIVAVALAAASGAACGGSSEKPAVESRYSKTTGKLELLVYDTNKDGTPDAWTHMDGTRLLRMDIDRDFNGVVDRWEYYAADGSIEKVGFSRASDGQVDAWAFQGGRGEIVRIEISTRRDGTVSRWEMYESGALVRAEEDSDGDGKVDKWETYRDGALASTALDTRRTGAPDRRLIYGTDGVRVEKIGKD